MNVGQSLVLSHERITLDTDLLWMIMTTSPARKSFHLLPESLSSPNQQRRLCSTILWAGNKSPRYIELSDSPALVPVCIGCSLSLQLSAWRDTVNDVFVLRSTFVLSWFLEQHKQAWNLFRPPRKNGRHSSLRVHNSAGWMRESESDLCFAAPLCLFGRFYLQWGKKTFVSHWTEL